MNKIARLLIGLHRPRTTSILYAWGNNTYGQLGNGSASTSFFPLASYSPLISWRMLAAGSSGDYVLGLKSDDTLWGWGYNGWGTLGDGTTVSRSSPIQVGLGIKWQTIAAGGRASYGITKDGLLYAWGTGLLGDGTTNSASLPQRIGTSSWTAVATSGNHTAAIRSDGLLFTWGINTYGQLGHVTSTSTSSPVMVGGQTIGAAPTATVNTQAPSILGAASLASSTVPTVGNSDDGYWTVTLPWSISFLGTTYSTIYVGTNSYITFGSGSTTYSALGASNPALPKIMIFSGDRSGQRIYYGTEGTAPNRTYRVRFEGSTGTSGTLGSPTHGYEAVFYEATPSRIDINLYAGSLTGPCGIYTSSSTVATFTSTDLSVTSAVSFYTGISGGTYLTPQSWSQVSCSQNNIAAIRSDGTLWSWGDSTNYGQVGDLTTVARSSPVQVGADTWLAVKLGTFVAYGIKSDSTLWSWGLGIYGGTVDTTNKSSPVQIGSDSWSQLGGGTNYVTAIRKSDKTLWGWGTNSSGQLSLYSTPQSWTSLAAGYGHTVAIKNDGTLWAWGLDSYGQIGDGPATIYRSSPVQIGTSSWTAVSAGRLHTLAIKNDGTLWAWGYNTVGTLGDGTTIAKYSPVQIGTDSWTFIDAGVSASMAIRADGTLWGWGYNAYGLLGDQTTISRSSPVQIGIGYSWTSVSTGLNHILAVRSDSTLWGWGDDFWGQVGKPENFTAQRSWVQISTRTDYTSNSAYWPIHAIASDGGLWTWSGDGSANVLLMSGTGGALTSPALEPYKVGTDSWIQVTTGGAYVHAIRSDNKLFTWGKNQGYLGTGVSGVDYSVPTLVDTPTTFTQISSGQSHTLAIASDGTLWGWGSNANWQLSTNAVGPTYSWSQVDVGDKHTLAIRSDGALWAWGTNTTGQLGDGTTSTRLSPVQIGTSSWTTVSAGFQHSLAIRSDGTLWAWGMGTSGQIGDNTIVSKSSPIQIGTDNTWSKVGAGFHSSVAIKNDGTLWEWGYTAEPASTASFGTTFRSSPIQIGTDANWSTISSTINNPVSGRAPIYALKTDNTLWGWGTSIPAYTPPRSWVQLAAPRHKGTYQVLAGINHLGELYITGRDAYGLATGVVTTNKIPFTKHGNYSWSQVSLGGDATILAIRSDGTLWAWGSNLAGQVGDNTVIDRSSPVQIGSGTNWSKVNVGGYGPTLSAAAIKTDGTLWTWGLGGYGQLGDGIGQSRSSPVQVGIGTSWQSVSVGARYMLATSSSGLYAWGQNNYGQLGFDPLPASRPTSWSQIASGWEHTVGIGSDGSLWAWGGLSWGNYGQLGINTGVSSMNWPVKIGSNSWSQVAASDYGTVAIRNDGTLWAWGQNDAGQVGDNTTINRSSPVQIGSGTNWSKIAGGRAHVLAIKSDGTLWAWGFGGYGQLGDNNVINRSSPVQIGSGTNWSKITCTRFHSAALTTTGALWSWGEGGNGIIGDGTTVAKSSPVQIGTSSWTHISGGPYHMLASIGQSLYGWGYGGAGALDGFTSNRSSPVYVGSLEAGYTDAFVATAYASIRRGGQGYVQARGYVTDNGTTAYRNDSFILNSELSWRPIAASKYTIGYYGTSVYYTSTTSPGRLTLNGSSTPFVDGPPYPVQVSNAAWTYVEAGNAHSVGVKSDTTLWTWGYNSDGQLGVSDTVARSSPIQVGSTGWAHASVTEQNTLAVKTDGTLWTWGWGGNSAYYTPLGSGYTGSAQASRSSPVQIGATPYSRTFTKGSFWYGSNGVAPDMVFLDSQGFAYFSTGQGGGGQFDVYLDGTTSPIVTAPTELDGQLYYPVVARSPIVCVSGSYTQVSSKSMSQGAAISASNNYVLRIWGDNTYGQLGQSTTGNSAWSPTSSIAAPPGSGGWTYVSAAKSIGAIANNTLYAWGRNDAGQLGLGDTVSRSSPVQVGGGTLFFNKIVYGVNTAIAISNNSSKAYTMGYNTDGMIGDSTTASKSTPTLVGGSVLTLVSTPMMLSSQSWKQVVAGDRHGFAIASDDTLWGWGYNSASRISNSAIGQLSFVQLMSGVKSVATSESHTVVITTSNTVVQWGTHTLAASVNSNTIANTTSTIGQKNPIYIAARINSTAIVTADGCVFEYGQATNKASIGYGSLTVPTAQYISNLLGYDTPTTWNMASKVTYSTSALHIIGTDNKMYTYGSNLGGRLGINRAYGLTGLSSNYDFRSLVVQVGGHGLLYSSPVQIGTDSWIQVSAGSQYSLGINSSHLLFGWGHNDYGALGQPYPNNRDSRSAPVQIGTDSWIQVSAGPFTPFGLKNNNTLWVWGDVDVGGEGGQGIAANGIVTHDRGMLQIGGSWTFVNASKTEFETYPSTSNGEKPFTGGIRTDGLLYAWGHNGFGQLGKGNVISRSSPVQLGNDPFALVSLPTMIDSGRWVYVAQGTGETTYATREVV